MTSYKPRIAIVGGGPAGLTLAVLLHKRSIPFTVFELRPKPTEAELKEPSGLLDLHEESGLAALRACDLMDEFTPLAGLCSQAQIVVDGSSTVLHRDEGEVENRPEIARHDLSSMLLRHLPEDSVRWQRKLISAASKTSGDATITTLDFGPHGTEDFDLVVGADGAWSRVRPLLTDAKPFYLGQQAFAVTARNLSTKFPKLAEFVGTGSLMCLGAGNAILSHRAAQDSAILYVTVQSEDPDLLAAAAQQPASKVKDVLLADDKLFGTYTGAARQLLATACDEDSLDHPGRNADFRRLYALPAGLAWPHRPGVTLIGDAAHLMSPFAGEGVNVSMWDSLDLAGIVAAACEARPRDAAAFQAALEAPMVGFEKTMVERAGERAQEAIDNSKVMFAQDGAKQMAGFFQSVGLGMGPPGQEPGQKPAR